MEPEQERPEDQMEEEDRGAEPHTCVTEPHVMEEDEEDEAYCVDGYPSELFRALKDFRDASLLTDLTLSTADGASLQVHAAVLAAVSSHLRHRLRERTEDSSRIHICLGPEVDAVGLAAVVEFAYAGVVSALDPDTVQRVEAAAGTLGACRVVELCRRPGRGEGEPEKPGDRQKEEQEVTLRAIEKMRSDKVGCDVVLEAIGGSLHGE
ncbi:unnamed protein product [Tetraodon nigroviridis]|uniref:(spotted green pufferfish) hypothetical protein n=1 Tax=Tetraodon nigroviridis TaxID=99883 RepID=Q4SQR0_TETNG|nr:unnamed protein product [Tetraodon nigroviridis]